jgi:glycosyltransferase involved in cell wall biosynthesis
MKIGIVGPIWHNIPPRGYGGTELMIYNLVNELSKKHEVSLFGPKTSKVKARLIPTVPKPLKDTGESWQELSSSLGHITTAFDTVNEFDILHVQLNRIQDYIALPLAARSKVPVVLTVHFVLPHKERYYERARILSKYSYLPLVSISNSQRRGSKLNFIATVYNGVDLNQFKFNEKAQDYFVWMAKMMPFKGAREAIVAAKKANVKLKLVGPVDETSSESTEYFNKEIKPLLDDDQIVWLGELRDREKKEILSNARALINPIKWEEPFGMVMLEAQAFGTPVIAFDRGSAKELIKDGISGFIVKNSSQLVNRIKRIDEIDRREVRKNAERFGTEHMAKGYEDVYNTVVKNWNKYLSKAK